MKHGWLHDRAFRNYITWELYNSNSDKSHYGMATIFVNATNTYNSLHHINNVCIGHQKLEDDPNSAVASVYFKKIHKSANNYSKQHQ